MENLFSSDDILLYKAVLLFYKGDYREAIHEFRQSWKMKKRFKNLENDETKRREDEDTDDEIGNSDEEDSIDIHGQ